MLTKPRDEKKNKVNQGSQEFPKLTYYYYTTQKDAVFTDGEM